MERTIARCRMILSVVALAAIYLDPTTPMSLPALDLRGGSLLIDPRALVVLLAHLVFSVAVYAALARRTLSEHTIGEITTWTDVVFAGAIAAVTEGVSSPFYAFFVFAVLASGFRSGPRRVTVVIAVAVAMYLSLILVSGRDQLGNFYLMRPVYLAVVGYLIVYLGRQRLELEGTVRELEAEAERGRIASHLHDGSLQSLVAVALRLESLRELLRQERYDEALADASALQREVEREYHGLRAYVRDLARVGEATASQPETDPVVSIDARFSCPLPLVDDFLQIVREALTNVKRHAHAHSAAVSAHDENGQIEVRIDDDGVGFEPHAGVPWSIASKVKAAGGDLRLDDAGPGAHLRIALPRRARP